MKRAELRDSVWDLSFAVSLSQYYYQRLCWWCALADRLIRLAVGGVAVWGLVLATSDVGKPPSSIAAIVSIGFALALNILPIHTWEMRYYRWHTEWSKLRQRLERFEVDAFGKLLDAHLYLQPPEKLRGSISAELEEEYSQILDQRAALEIEEKQHFRWLVDWCHLDENERRWGKGNRTDEQVTQEINRRLHQPDVAENAVPVA